jgi:hypothetical protein
MLRLSRPTRVHQIVYMSLFPYCSLFIYHCHIAVTCAFAFLYVVDTAFSIIETQNYVHSVLVLVLVSELL